jgi:hypothetical protein
MTTALLKYLWKTISKLCEQENHGLW